MCIPFPLLLRLILGPCPKSSAPDSQGNARISPSQSGQIPGKQAVFSLVVPGWRRQYIQAILGHSRRQWSLRALPRQMSEPVGKTIPGQRAEGQWRQVELTSGLPGEELRIALSRLERADVVTGDEQEGIFRVQALAYPAVRRYLQSKGYPVDSF